MNHVQLFHHYLIQYQFYLPVLDNLYDTTILLVLIVHTQIKARRVLHASQVTILDDSVDQLNFSRTGYELEPGNWRNAGRMDRDWQK